MMLFEVFCQRDLDNFGEQTPFDGLHFNQLIPDAFLYFDVAFGDAIFHAGVKCHCKNARDQDTRPPQY